jgi:lysophospholipase L1-like esterase
MESCTGRKPHECRCQWALSGLNRYLSQIDLQPDYGFIALGTNDALNDGLPMATVPLLTALTTNLNTVIAGYKNNRIAPLY